MSDEGSKDFSRRLGRGLHLSASCQDPGVANYLLQTLALNGLTRSGSPITRKTEIGFEIEASLDPKVWYPSEMVR
jgi:hypothetical protein